MQACKNRKNLGENEIGQTARHAKSYNKQDDRVYHRAFYLALKLLVFSKRLGEIFQVFCQCSADFTDLDNIDKKIAEYRMMLFKSVGEKLPILHAYDKSINDSLECL